MDGLQAWEEVLGQHHIPKTTMIDVHLTAHLRCDIAKTARTSGAADVGLSLDVVAYTAPQELTRGQAAERRGQPPHPIVRPRDQKESGRARPASSSA